MALCNGVLDLVLGPSAGAGPPERTNWVYVFTVTAKTGPETVIDVLLESPPIVFAIMNQYWRERDRYLCRNWQGW